MKHKFLVFAVSFCLVVGGIYTLAAFTETPILSEMRNIWIETAMTTGDHQWLATKLFPQSVINKVMAQQVNEIDGIAGIQDDVRLVEVKPITQVDILGQTELVVDGDDGHGGTVIFNNPEQGILVSKIKNNSYVARLVQIDDPSRVFIGTTEEKGSRGTLICDYLKAEDAIVGINASGFVDYGGKGFGGDLIGATKASGDDWGDYYSQLYTMGFTEDDKLIAGDIPNWNDYRLRDAMQSKPVLIKDGEILTKNSSGWGLQPRTIVAQRADGVVLFLVVDGRKPGYSIGATMGECAELLLEYGAVTAAACDGGSSSVLAYDGAIINRPSTPMKTGRYLPNAFLVSKK